MRAQPFRKGFVDISMYVVLDIPSKNAASLRPDNLRRIFRKLRLAVFGRICRLPIGLGSLWARTRSWFPILRCRMSGIESGIVAAAAGDAPAAARPVAGIFRPIFGRVPAASGQIGETPGVASDPPGWTCVLYLRCKPKRQTRHFDGQPQGVFWQANQHCKWMAIQNRNRQQRKWGRSRHSG